MSDQLTELQNELTEETVRRLMIEARDPKKLSMTTVTRLREATERLRGLIQEAQHDGAPVGDVLYRLLDKADALIASLDARILDANKAPNGAVVAV